MVADTVTVFVSEVSSLYMATSQRLSVVRSVADLNDARSLEEIEPASVRTTLIEGEAPDDARQRRTTRASALIVRRPAPEA
jgi:hypothetical protein